MNRRDLTDLLLARADANKNATVKTSSAQIKNGAAASDQKIDFVHLVNAVALWAHISTNNDLAQAPDVRRAKLRAVREFFAATDKDLSLVTPLEVRAWQQALEKRGLKARTVYLYSAHLSAFFEWLRRQPEFKEYLPFNPVRAAFPKLPAPYTSEHTRSLTDEELGSLWTVIEHAAKADSDLAALRDNAIFRFFTATGARRSEILELRGKDLVLPAKTKEIVFFPRAKGGERTGKTVADPEVRRALENYLRATNRIAVIGTDAPVWLAHDRGARTRSSGTETRLVEQDGGEQSEQLTKKNPSHAAERGLTSRAFANRMKQYANRAGLNNFHLHQLRHTFARIVAEDTGSLSATQEALGHKDMKTTGIYVRRIQIAADQHSTKLSERIKNASIIGGSKKSKKMKLK